MKFTNGYWLPRDGMTPLFAQAAHEIVTDGDSLTAYAPTRPVQSRGDTLNQAMLTVNWSAPAPDVIRVRIVNHRGAVDRGPRFAARHEPCDVRPQVDDEGGTLTSGALSVHVRRGAPWQVEFSADGRPLTSSVHKSVAAIQVAGGGHYLHEQLTLGIGEQVYGLGERFGPVAKNGQSVDIWNDDGGTASEQAYKNVPFYLTSAGYGVFVDTPDRVSFEVASEVVTRTQFSVEGQSLQYYVIYGPTPKDVLRKYTALTGRPARVPDWSFGLWLSTSFTSSYDEQLVKELAAGMAERQLPLSVLHFDCFWMRGFHWTDLQWDEDFFPDPAGMLRSLHDSGLRATVWINPYIAQRSRLFDEGMANGYLVRRPDGSVWQWDMWQAGMALVDFTNPEAVAWYQSHLRALLEMGVDGFKTDFGERIPVDVVWHDGSDPARMHNYYTYLYNEAVFGLLREHRGEGEAVLFARSATVGSQQFPVHWGGDCESTFVSMAETLRGGLSLAFSGFGFWSHDIGGFEGTPDPALFKRWVAFGLLSSHSRLHGSDSYRVPWIYDDEAVDVTRRFIELKMRLMPYLARCADEAHTDGVPVLRPMLLEFPDDPGVRHVDTQYLLGPSLLVAPVFSVAGDVSYYVPSGVWTSLLSGEKVQGPGWRSERHGFDSLPLLVRPDTVLPFGARSDRPDYDHADGVTLRLYELADGHDSETVVGDAVFRVRRSGAEITVTGPDGADWQVEAAGAGEPRRPAAGESTVTVRV
ncbi:MAG TPA: alpha-xylosidase [Actinoplanes sp.]